ncbi:EamA family transporter, partial [Burkholderia sp. SIMBA_042]
RPLAQSATILRTRAFPLLVVGVLNSAAPFCLFAYAELTLSAGVTSVINATTPLWGALVAFLWLRDRLSALRTLGLVIGFLGV